MTEAAETTLTALLPERIPLVIMYVRRFLIMFYSTDTRFSPIDPPTYHIHGRMTRFGRHDFEEIFFCVALTLVYDVFIEGVFRSSLYYY